MFLGFLRIGATAFGGGSSTTMAMRSLSIGRRWLTEQEFLDTLVLSRLTPGITIIAQAMLIGKRACGARGLAAAVGGMMLPAVLITMGLARLYQVVSANPVADTPLRCVAAAAAGFAVAMAVQLLRDVLRRHHGWIAPLAILTYAGVSLAVGNPIVLLIVAVAAGIAVPRSFLHRERDDEP